MFLSKIQAKSHSFENGMNFDKICRLCCDRSSRLYSILEERYTYSLKSLFSDILQIEISADDDLPQQICELCRSTLSKMHETIKAFRENDRMLRLQRYGELMQVDIKEEIFDTEETNHVFIQELNIDVGDQNMLTQSIENDQQATSDLELHEEWLQSDTESLPDTFEKKKKSANKQRNRKQKDDRKQARGRRGGRPRTRFEDPNRPRLNDFICYICKSDSLGTPEALLAHLDSHLNMIPYTCTACVLETVVISRVTTLNIHMRMHENPHKCPHCDRRYSNKRAIDTHVQTFHLGDNAPCPSPCDQCGKVCSSNASLKQHQKLHTSGSTCEICGKIFIGKHKLRRHIERIHEKIKKFECYLCQKKLSSLTALQVHIKTMHSTKEVKCVYCDKSYPSELSLRYHLKKHEQNPNVKFSSNWKDYYTFVEADEGTRPEDRLKKCNLCGSVFKSIAPHMHLVHFPTEYKCELCDMVFKRKSSYNTHVLEHKHGKAHRCPICGKEISDRKNLIAHLRTKKHRDHPLSKCLDWLNIQKGPDRVVVKVDRNDSECETEIKPEIQKLL
ncbi:zinc finger protein 37-like [Malaya genurostris]|uniref:zinc finger protein 37-like n=1 Tax=Malaya genurostris TaxID=325434 RepID=UPI0026F3AF2E|nr:zinc finger protein 37-like [Malaya genurostris]